MRLECENLSYFYPKTKKPVLEGLTFSLEPGAFWAIVGPNGAGKSTFLKLVCGLLPQEFLTGNLLWDKKPLSLYDRKELARNVAFVPAGLRALFPVTVFDFVLQGRYAHQEFWQTASSHDTETANAALERVGISGLRGALVSEISAGEVQLALLARAIAQNPKVYFLDETTSHLDLGHQGRIFSLLGELNKNGASVVVVSHDVNLAGEFCPNLLWLNEGRVKNAGPAQDTLNTKVLESIYGRQTQHLGVGKNPFSGKPKVFWKP